MTGFKEWRAESQAWDHAPELWELQTNPHLTVGELRRVLSDLDPALPVTVSFYDGSTAVDLRPTEVGFARGVTPRPDRVVITAIMAEQ